MDVSILRVSARLPLARCSRTKQATAPPCMHAHDSDDVRPGLRGLLRPPRRPKIYFTPQCESQIFFTPHKETPRAEHARSMCIMHSHSSVQTYQLGRASLGPKYCAFMLDYYDQNKHICDVEKIVQWLQSRTAHVYMTLFMKSYTTP